MKKNNFLAVLLSGSLLILSCAVLAAQSQSDVQNNSDSSVLTQNTGTQSFSISTDPSKIQLNSSNYNNSQNQNRYNDNSPSTIWVFFKMIIGLLVVLGIVWGIFHFLKKSMKISNDNDPFLRKVSSIQLSPGKSVQIITLQDSAFVIGVSDENINLLGKVEDKELVNAMNLYADKNEEVKKPRSFAEILDIFMPGSSKEAPVDIYSGITAGTNNNSNNTSENQ